MESALEHLKNCGKNTRKSADAVAEFARAQNALIFVHDLHVCANPNSEEDVIYLRALCWASYRNSDKYIIYELAYPRLRNAYAGTFVTYTNNQICRTIRNFPNYYVR